MGTLYYGDNLDILRRYLKDDSVDLVYLDPRRLAKTTHWLQPSLMESGLYGHIQKQIDIGR